MDAGFKSRVVLPKLKKLSPAPAPQSKSIRFYLDHGIFPGENADLSISYHPSVFSRDAFFDSLSDSDNEDAENKDFKGTYFEGDPPFVIKPDVFEAVVMTAGGESPNGGQGGGSLNRGRRGSFAPGGSYYQGTPEHLNHPTIPLIGDTDPDDPPFPEGSLGRTTVGVEFEFLVAAAREDNVPDAHPNDTRQLLQGTEGHGYETPRFEITVRNAIVDALRANGIIAVKGESAHIYLGATPGFGWSSRLDDDINNNNNNLAVLNTWVGKYTWNPLISDYQNLDAAANQLLSQFLQFHEFNELRFQRTTEAVILAIAQNISTFFISGAPQAAADPLMNLWAERTKQVVEERKRKEEAQDNSAIDPNSVFIPGADPRYRAWTCTRDASFGPETMNPDHYDLSSYVPPPGSNPPAPPSEYKWFSGEVITPILDIAHPDTYPALERACSAIRNSFRVHKPMSIVGTGLHVHWGQEAGWTLLHLKKFSTLWILLEESIEKIHRRDRSAASHFYSQSLRANSNLAKNLLIPSDGPPARSTVRNRDPAKSAFYEARANQHVPFELDQISYYMQTLVTELWQYETIDELDRGMNTHRGSGHVKYRLGGITRTDPPSTDPLRPILQTLEIRIMQGTLDSEHVWHWMVICHQLIAFSRDSTPEQFRNGLASMLTSTQDPADVLGIPADVLMWFRVRLNMATGYFEYLDKDRVSWSAPFMTRGGRNVYF